MRQRGRDKVRGHEVSTVEDPSNNSAELRTQNQITAAAQIGVGNASPDRRVPYQGSTCS